MPWKYHDFEETLTNPDRVYLVAEAAAADAKERILGGCMLTNIAGEGDITNVAVREQYRGRKIATALMEALLKLGRERYGITAFTLEESSAARIHQRETCMKNSVLSQKECARAFMKNQKTML